MPRSRTYISIGSNLNDPLAQVKEALRMLQALPVTRLRAYSPLCFSPALGGPPNQPDCVNAVALLETELPPLALLDALHALETRQGRVRTERWGARTLDLDILLYGNQVSTSPHITLPHPRLRERPFVIYPLYALAPNLILPDGTALCELLAQYPPPVLLGSVVTAT